MKRDKSGVLLFLLILSATSLAACGSDSSSVSVQEWQITYERDKSLEDVSSKEGWEKIADISDIRMPRETENKLHYITLRGTFYIDESPAEYYGLSMGSVRFVDRTYINGTLVGSQLPEQVNWNPRPRNYRIQNNILKKGENEIYIVLGIYGNERGGISEDVLLQPKDEFVLSNFFTNLTYNQFPFAIMFLHICLSIQFFIFFLWERREKHYLYVSISLLIAAFYIILFLPSYIQLDFKLSHSLRFSCVIIISILNILTLQSLYRIYLTAFNRVIIPVLTGLVLLIQILNHKFYPFMIINLVVALAFIVIASSSVFLIYRLNLIHRLNQKNPDRFLRNMVITGVAVFGLIIILEIFAHVSGGFHPGFISIFVPPLLIMLYQTIVSRESRKRRVEMEILYNRLKKRSAGSEQNETDMLNTGISPLTDASERKLKKVIEFIEENYISDLSREGLAAAVDMHPNYMGKLFKTYTGKTINEYINHLRIKDAINKLESADSRIIDIAFSLGFESIVTFNRVFKKETGKTPSEYKKSG